MKITKLAAITGGLMLGELAGAAFQFNAVSAAVPASRHSSVAVSAPVASPTPSPSPSPSCPPMTLAIAFTDNVTDTSALHLHLPWGRPGDPEGQMVEDYGSYNGTTIRKHLPVHDVTTGTLVELFGHNAIDIVLDSGTPLYAVTSGTNYRITNWTTPAFPQGHASVVVSDVLKDDQGDAIAFLYGHVREFDVPNGQHVVAGELIAKSGGDPDDPGAGFSDMANVFYWLTWYLHFQHVLPAVVPSGTRPLIVNATLGTKNKQKLHAQALKKAVQQSVGRIAAPRGAYWTAASHPLLQAADYYTWALGARYERDPGENRPWDVVKHQFQRIVAPYGW